MKAKVLIVDIYNIMGIGAVLVGVVKEGIFKLGMVTNINGVDVIVNSIECNHIQLKEATAEMSIGFNLKNIKAAELRNYRNQIMEFKEREVSNNSQIKSNPFHPRGLLSRFFGRILMLHYF